MTNLMSQLIPQQPSNHLPTPHQQRMKPIRPTIEADSSDNKWVIFKDAWQRYKEMAALRNPNEIRNELRSACSSSVNEMLFNFVGPDALQGATEEQLLSFIKSVAVKSIHPEVYRQQFFQMRQGDGETITTFVSRLKSQAMLCNFKRKCDCTTAHCNTTYSEDMIKSQVIAGLRDVSHQSKVLTEVSALPTLQALIERLLTLESTARATNHFQPSDSSSTSAIKSDYQKSKFHKQATPPSTSAGRNNKSKPQPLNKCKGCGRTRHPEGRRACPAFGKICSNCSKPNHYSTVCFSSPSNNAIIEGEEESANEEFSFLSSISATSPL